jgi:hypothetical protein
MVNQAQQAPDGDEDDGAYNELSADAGDERRIRQQAAALADVQQPEAVTGGDDPEDASPDEVEIPMPHGESVEYQVRPFDESVVREEDLAQGVATVDIEHQPQRVRDRLNEIERDVDDQLQDEAVE